MGKILGSWSAMRKYLEQEMTADPLRGRIRYGCTSYKGMDGCHIFEICIDGRQIKRFSLETVNSYFINNGYTQNKDHFGKTEYWSEFWSLLHRYPVSSRTEYTDEEFCNALEQYRNQDITQSIYSDDPLVRMFAVSDRRVGKRTLVKLKETLETQPDWLKIFYMIRFTAEGI